jgi:hypothetical protein
MIGSIGQPLLFLVALGFGFGPIYQKAEEGIICSFSRRASLRWEFFSRECSWVLK